MPGSSSYQAPTNTPETTQHPRDTPLPMFSHNSPGEESQKSLLSFTLGLLKGDREHWGDTCEPRLHFQRGTAYVKRQERGNR